MLFVVLMFALPFILIGIEGVFWAFLVFCCWRAFKAWSESKPQSMVIWLMIVAAPFLFYIYKLNAVDAQEAKRADFVANLKRHEISEQHPKLVEIYGPMTIREIIILLDVLNIEEVVKFDRYKFKGKIDGAFYKLSSNCKGLGKEYQQLVQRGRNIGYPDNNDRACLISRNKKVNADRRMVPAIVFLNGRHTTLRQKDNNYSGGSLEVRLRTGKENYLLDYWERPVFKRPTGLGPLSYLNRATSDRQKYRSPGRTTFFMEAMSNNH